MTRLTDYQLGVIRGLSMYAWWKDGTQYVGTTGTTLRQAVERIAGRTLTREEYEEILSAAYGER